MKKLVKKIKRLLYPSGYEEDERLKQYIIESLKREEPIIMSKMTLHSPTGIAYLPVNFPSQTDPFLERLGKSDQSPTDDSEESKKD